MRSSYQSHTAEDATGEEKRPLIATRPPLASPGTFDGVERAHKFLTHPRVASQRVDKKVAFLESKNCSPYEIEQALRLVGDLDDDDDENDAGGGKGEGPRGYGFGAYLGISNSTFQSLSDSVSDDEEQRGASKTNSKMKRKEKKRTSRRKRPTRTLEAPSLTTCKRYSRICCSVVLVSCVICLIVATVLFYFDVGDADTIIHCFSSGNC